MIFKEKCICSISCSILKGGCKSAVKSIVCGLRRGSNLRSASVGAEPRSPGPCAPSNARGKSKSSSIENIIEALIILWW